MSIRPSFSPSVASRSGTPGGGGGGGDGDGGGGKGGGGKGGGDGGGGKGGAWILEVLGAADDESVGEKVRSEIATFCSDFPVPGIS